MYATGLVVFLSTCLGAEVPGNPDNLLKRAFVAERDAQPKLRNELLQLASHEGESLAWWSLGYVKVDGQWQTAMEIANQTSSQEKFKKYLQVRREHAPIIQSEILLADWCQKHDLPLQWQAHLRVAVFLDPTNENAQRGLGRVLQDGEWIASGDRQRRRERDREALRLTRQWQRQLQKLVRGLGTTREDSQDATVRSILAIRDPVALSILEEFLAQRNEFSAQLLVSVLSQIHHAASSDLLIRLTVFSTWEAVRASALEILCSRDPEHHVPVLIEYLRPTDSGVEWIPGIGEVWSWQDYGTNYLHVRDFRLLSLEEQPGRIRDGRQIRIDRSASKFTDANNTVVQSKYASVQEANNARLENTLFALKQLTSMELGSDIHAWREWWASSHSLAYNQALAQMPTRNTEVSGGSTSQVFLGGSNQPPNTASCFAAGTPVWSITGPQPIDQLRTGDLVLSLDIETGELMYKPVLQRTLRGRVATIACKISNETLQMTKVHPVWEAGKGWRFAETLQGATVRTFNNLVRVDSVQPADEVEVYNLVVADNNTYFVGHSGVLVHDVTPIQELPRVVPGMIGE